MIAIFRWASERRGGRGEVGRGRRGRSPARWRHDKFEAETENDVAMGTEEHEDQRTEQGLVCCNLNHRLLRESLVST